VLSHVLQIISLLTTCTCEDKLDECCLIVRRFINDIWACVGGKYHTYRVWETVCLIETGNWTCAVVPFNCGLRWLYATEWILYPPNIYEFWINSCGMFYWASKGTLDFVYANQIHTTLYMWTSSTVDMYCGMFFFILGLFISTDSKYFYFKFLSKIPIGLRWKPTLLCVKLPYAVSQKNILRTRTGFKYASSTPCSEKCVLRCGEFIVW
jgi:hypothetical protein